MASSFLSLPPELRQAILGDVIFDNSICFGEIPASICGEDLIAVLLSNRQIKEEAEQMVRLRANLGQGVYVVTRAPAAMAGLVESSWRYLKACERANESLADLGIAKTKFMIFATLGFYIRGGAHSEGKSGHGPKEEEGMFVSSLKLGMLTI